MPIYKHNDYYRYIKYIQQKGISDPQWFWSDSEDASQARQWLYNNGASAIVNDIYKNTPEEIQKTIPSNYLSQNLQNTRYINDVRKRNENAGKVVTEVAAGVAGAPALITGVTVAPIATGLGLLGGTAGSIGGSKIGSRVGNAVYSRKTENDGVGSLVSTNRETGATVGGLVGGTIGGIAGASIVKPIANSQVYKGLQLARALNKGVKNAEIVDSPVTQNILAGKLGWAPRQNKVIWHNSETPISKLESTFPAWDIVKRDAPLGHVWGTGTETTQGFIGARPFHLRSTNSVEMNKPMVQLNEAIGNGNNAVRNEILKFADRSGADAVNFSNIKDNTLPNQDVYAVFKDIEVRPKLSEAERLGIPKGERSNPKALEDPQYWGYKQWNDRYNTAIESGNVEEAQRLRDLHFKIKAPDTKVVDKNGRPLHTYHGFLPSRRGVFTKFKGVNYDVEHAVKEGSKINHWKLSVPNEYRMTSYHTPDYNHALTSYAHGNPDNVYDDYLYIKHPFTWNEENLHNILLNSGHKSEKIPFNEPGHFRKMPIRDINGNWLSDKNGLPILKDSDKWIPEKSGFRYPQVSDWADFRGNSKTELMKLGYDGLHIPQYYDSYGAFVSPSQFKSAEPITRTGTGEIIPIVKRDNFHNLDRRYKQGGVLKGQNPQQ